MLKMPCWSCFVYFVDKPFDQHTSQRGTFGKPSWFDSVRDEYNACKQTVGLVDVSSFSQVEIWVWAYLSNSLLNE